MKNFWYVFWDNFASAFKTKRFIVFFLLYLGAFILITFGLIQLQKFAEEQFKLQIEKQGVEYSEELKELMYEDLKVGIEESITDPKTKKFYLFLIKVPPVVLILFAISLFITPILIVLTGYDKISQEVYDGTIRFLLFRVKREIIYLAKFFASLLEFALVSLFVYLIAIFWMSFARESLDLGDMLLWGIRFWFLSLIFLSVFIAFTQLASTLIKRPFLSLILCLFALLFFWIIPFIFQYISPYGSYYLQGLMNTGIALIRSIFIYFGFLILFLGSGILIFKKKNL